MQKLKSKSMAIMIAILLIISMSASIMLIPNTNAHSPPWTIISYAYIAVAPNPVGVGQTIEVAMWIDAPMIGAALGNPVRRSGYELTITAPDGINTTDNWAWCNDPTGIQSYLYTPTEVGTYIFTFNYAGQNYTWTAAQGGTVAYDGDFFTAASRTTNLTVQQTPISQPIDSYPLPTEYWTYPIEGQNNYWFTIASNWLAQPYILNAGDAYDGGQQPYGSAPTSAHIMWTTPDGYGGVLGGNDTNVPGEQYYTGLSYNPRFNNPIIMQGVLYYQQAYGNSGTGGNYVAINLMTGAQLWSINVTATGTSLLPSFGYEYSYDGPNQHGVLPNGLLIATTTVTGLGTVWRAYDPQTGVLTTMNVTNVPGGSAVAGPAGEYLKYILTNYGNATNPKYYLAQWNSSDVFGDITGAALSPTGWYSGTENASLASCYDWNVSVNLGGSPASWAIGTCERGTQPCISLGNMILFIQGTFGGHVSDSGATITSDPANITAISLNPATLGKTLWTQSYPQAPLNETRFLSAWDPNTGVFVFSDKEDFANLGYSLATGQLLWGPSYPPTTPSVDWNFPIWYTPCCIYGNLYADGFSGLLYCWNDSTGALEWTFGNGGAGNSTFAGLYTPYGYYPMFIECIGNGIIYMAGNDHSPNSPMYKNSPLIAVNATDGTELWSIFGWGNEMSGAEGAIADGYLTVYNPYDSQIYSYGQGPSQLTVTAPQASIALGSSLVISGMVTDISAGTKQQEQAADFPNGVPCVSDASQGAWMEYVYMQKPKPTNATGVPVTLTVTDSNGNTRPIGTTTSDSSGAFSFQWAPDITGKYTVTATFAGSNAYYGSSAETAFAVDSAAATPAPTQAPQQSTVDQYFVPAVAGIIVAIAIGFAITILVLRKRP
jgi:hypothetical protein